jgi:multiple sugar transport system substrate-binding protein
MRKILVALFIVLLAAACTIGYVGAAEAKQPVTVSLETWLVMEGASKETMEEMARRFEQKNPDIKIELIGIPYEQVVPQVQIMVAGGNAPDIIALAPRTSVPFVKMGALADITSYYSKEELADIPKSLYEDGVFDGKVFTVPWQIGTIVVLAWKELLAKAGLPAQIPETWDELKVAVKKISDLGKGVYGFGARTSKTQNSAMWFIPVLEGHGGKFEDGKGKVTFGDQRTIDALNWYKEIGTTKQTPIGMGVREVRNVFAQGKIGFVFDGPWMKGIMRTISGKGEAIDNDYIVGPFPKASDGKRYGLHNSHVLSISKQCKHKEEAVRVIKFLTQDEEVTKFYYKKMGAIPVYKKLLKDPLYANDPFAQAFIQSAEFARGVASRNVQYSTALEFVATAMQKALLGRDTSNAAKMAYENIKTVYGQ